VQGSLSRELYQLPGGPLQLGLIASYRFESIYNPSANPDSNGAIDRWFTINPFGVIGHRSSEAFAFELDAPIVKQFDVDISGRYDSYSSGQSAFSPKFEAKFTPIKYVTLRSTYSEGFRIPSLAESNELPTTGFISSNAPISFQNAHGNDGYGLGYSLGLTTVGTQGLKPETSENFTAGIVLEPTRRLSFSFDYYYIKKNNVIQANSAGLGPAIAAYFAGQPIPTGFKITPGVPDANAPNAPVLPGFVQYGFVNDGVETTSGYDIGATARFDLPFDIKYTSTFDGNYVLNLDLDSNGSTQHYAGSIGPFVDVSASGTPKFRANWQNSFARGPWTFTTTLYYTSGYDLEAEDQSPPDTVGVCIKDGASNSNVNAVFQDGQTPVQCKTKSFWDTNANINYQVNKRLQVYLNIENLFDTKPPLDPTTYGGFNYNPAWSNAGIYGRTFRVGLRANF
jgi:iron complex outermembrane receptor protein